MKISLTFLISIALLSCASNQKPSWDASSVEVYLSPQIDHYQSNKAIKQSAQLAHITDNDGNIYNTYWKVAEASHNNFEDRVEYCKQKLTDLTLFPGDIQLSTLNVDQLKPILYKPFVGCILQAGFELSYREAFSPVYFHVGLHRTPSINESYIPVDATLKVNRQGADLVNLFTDIQSCQQKLLAMKQPPQIEQRIRDAVHINLSPFAQNMKQCLEKKFYSVTLLPKESANSQRIISSAETISPDPLVEAVAPLKLPPIINTQ